MKPFKFKLEKILEYRTQLEDQARLALSAAKAAHDEQEDFVRSVAARLEEHKAKQTEATKTTQDMWLWQQFRNALEYDLAEGQIKLRQLASNLQKVRQQAVQRSRDRKLLETLKDKQARKHNESASAQEQKENDEMATLRYERKDI